MNFDYNCSVDTNNMMFGGAGIASLYEPITDIVAKDALEAAYYGGIKYYDTAPLYGAGRSEILIGKYLPNSSEIMISTKVGRLIRSKQTLTSEQLDIAQKSTSLFKIPGKVFNFYPVDDYSFSGIFNSVTESQKRLQDKKITCIRLHDAETDEKFNLATTLGSIEAMVGMKEQGMVNTVSLGMNDPKYIMKFLDIYSYGSNKLDSIMMAGSWNLMDQSGLDVLKRCEELDVDVHLAGIFGGGFLWGVDKLKYTDPDPIHYEKLERWKKLCERYEVTLQQVALNFAFAPKCVKYICLGCAKKEHVEQNLELSRKKIPEELIEDAFKVKLLSKE